MTPPESPQLPLLTQVLDTVPVIVFATDAQGVFTLSQGSGLQVLGLQPDQLVGQSVFTVYAGEPVLLDELRRALQGEAFETLVAVGPAVYQTSYRPLRSADGTLLGLSGVSVDVTAQVQAQRQAQTLLALSALMDEEQDTASVEHSLTAALAILSGSMSLDFLVCWERHGETYDCLAVHGDLTPPAEQQLRLGVSATYFRGLGVLDGQAVFWGPQDLPPEVVRLEISALALLPLTLPGQATPLLLGAYRRGAHVGVWTPAERGLLLAAARSLAVSRSRQLWVAGLDAAAHIDPLTGLGNRRAFRRDLDRAIQQASGGEAADQTPDHASGQCAGPFSSQPLGLLSVDIDGLKQLNDRLGHDQGDALLRQFSQALQQALGSTAPLYRLGGDEFVALLPELGRWADADDRAAWEAAPSRIIDRLEQATRATRDAGFPQVAASGGVAVFPAEASSAEGLFQLADERMYAAKSQALAARPRVLVVEDQPGMARLIDLILQAGGYEVILVSSTDAARARVQGGGIDLLLSDMALPEGPQAGLALLRALRAEGHTLPVLFLSANTDPQLRVSGLQDGGDDYLVKPFGRAELVARVGALLRRSRAGRR
jgi:diguanylate cyclase (GGDEF)-like protein/PAS domain S-box-containing protein